MKLIVVQNQSVIYIYIFYIPFYIYLYYLYYLYYLLFNIKFITL